MSIKQAYDSWSQQYDSNENKTRDLEALALRKSLNEITFNHCLEIGCGTGKNTEWILTKAQTVTAVDLSTEMLQRAKEKIISDRVLFIEADVNGPWDFTEDLFDLITFSLVLEHIEDLDAVFKKTAGALVPGGHLYIGELHPFKQYNGSKARFETSDGTQVVECFTHNVSDFIQCAKRSGFSIADVNEYFDDEDRATVPRILTIVARKQ